MTVDSEGEIDIVDTKRKITTLNEESRKKRLPWYLLSDDSFFAKSQKLFVQIMTWSTIIVTPLTFLFPVLKNSTLNYEWFVDSVWCLEILLSFFKGDIHHVDTIQKSVRKYLTDGPLNVGAFWFDFISTIPPMLFKEEFMAINSLKFLRLYHVKEMYYPVEILFEYIFNNKRVYFRNALIDFIKFLLTILMLAHFLACLMCFVGKLDRYLGYEDPETWLEKADTQFTDTPWHYKYFFALYWVL